MNVPQLSVIILLFSWFETALTLQGKDVLPVVVATWNFEEAVDAGFKELQTSGDVIEALVEGCHVCEIYGKCDQSVGWGGHPNAEGETTLDAMVMDGNTRAVGAVGCVKNIRPVIKVAHAVMKHTKSTLLVGDDATKFAVQMGFKQESTQSDASRQQWQRWRANNCQPNYWKNVSPDPETSCGPYSPIGKKFKLEVPPTNLLVNESNHDTIGMVVAGLHGTAAGTSTNGLTYKIPGRVGDSPVPGAGAYADESGACAGTGDGDTMMRFLPCYESVLLMKGGMEPIEAARTAIRSIRKIHPDFRGSLVTVNARGVVGAATNENSFPFCYRQANMPSTKCTTVSRAPDV